MTRPLRPLLLGAAVAAVALGGGEAARAAHQGGRGEGAPPAAAACNDSAGYSCAQIGVPRHGYGISARIAQSDAFDVVNGHTAAWVGVGGKGQGPHGSNEWLQVGYVGLPSITGDTGDIYYEVALPDRFPAYHEVSTGVAIGTYTRVTVLEMHKRPNLWRVWVNHRPVSPPIKLPGSHDGLKATAETECWDGGTGSPCNHYSYSFRHVSIARAPGGDWKRVT
jgi:hypothetical protein